MAHTDPSSRYALIDQALSKRQSYVHLTAYAHGGRGDRKTPPLGDMQF